MAFYSNCPNDTRPFHCISNGRAKIYGLTGPYKLWRPADVFVSELNVRYQPASYLTAFCQRLPQDNCDIPTNESGRSQILYFRFGHRLPVNIAPFRETRRSKSRKIARMQTFAFDAVLYYCQLRILSERREDFFTPVAQTSRCMSVCLGPDFRANEGQNWL